MTWFRRPLLGLDFETTGVDPETDRIVTGCVVRYGGGRVTEPRTWLSDVDGVEIPAEAAAIHGVSTEVARSAGRPAGLVVAEITAALVAGVEAGLPIVAMSAPFDLTLLDREARRHNVRPLFDMAVPLVLDPRVLDKQLDRYRKGGRTLTDLCRHYCVRLDAAHSAEADAIAACAVTWKIAHRYQVLQHMSLGELHEEQAGWARTHGEGLRGYLGRTPGKEHLAASVAVEWPLIPPLWTGGRV